MKTDRVSLRADDALLAMCELRFAIERTDKMLTEYADDGEFCEGVALSRELSWQAYQRIAKALGLPPTLSTTPRSTP